MLSVSMPSERSDSSEFRARLRNAARTTPLVIGLKHTMEFVDDTTKEISDRCCSGREPPCPLRGECVGRDRLRWACLLAYPRAI
jgi:hypothetical protein